MSQEEFFGAIVQILNDLSIPYVLTGSNAANFYGEPRSTHDVDFVIAITRSDIIRLSGSFDRTQYYLDEEAIQEAIERESMFNIIDSHTGLKADFWLLKDDVYHQSCFSRRRKYSIFGRDTFILTPEDVILTKLEWYNLSGGSERQFKDVLGVYEVQINELDMDYIYKWAAHLGVRELVEEIVKEAEGS